MVDGKSYVIKSKRQFSIGLIKEIWEYRQLALSLAWKDIKVRYIQSFLGVFWVILNPLVNLIVLSFIFGTVVNADTEGFPIILYTITGLAGWNYFATLTQDSSDSIIQAQDMVKKIYFPRIILPISKAISGLFELLGTFIVLIICFLYYQFIPSYKIIYLPIFILLAIFCGLTFGIWVSSLTIRFRDIRFIVPQLVRVLFFITPIAYSPSNLAEKLQFLFFLNPVAGVIEGFRWCLLGSGNFSHYIFYSMAILLILFVLGVLVFYRVEKEMADIL